MGNDFYPSVRLAPAAARLCGVSSYGFQFRYLLTLRSVTNRFMKITKEKRSRKQELLKERSENRSAVLSLSLLLGDEPCSDTIIFVIARTLIHSRETLRQERG